MFMYPPKIDKDLQNDKDLSKLKWSLRNLRLQFAIYISSYINERTSPWQRKETTELSSECSLVSLSVPIIWCQEVYVYRQKRIH